MVTPFFIMGIFQGSIVLSAREILVMGILVIGVGVLLSFPENDKKKALPNKKTTEREE